VSKAVKVYSYQGRCICSLFSTEKWTQQRPLFHDTKQKTKSGFFYLVATGSLSGQFPTAFGCLVRQMVSSQGRTILAHPSAQDPLCFVKVKRLPQTRISTSTTFENSFCGTICSHHSGYFSPFPLRFSTFGAQYLPVGLSLKINFHLEKTHLDVQTHKLTIRQNKTAPQPVQTICAPPCCVEGSQSISQNITRAQGKPSLKMVKLCHGLWYESVIQLFFLHLAQQLGIWNQRAGCGNPGNGWISKGGENGKFENEAKLDGYV